MAKLKSYFHKIVTTLLLLAVLLPAQFMVQYLVNPESVTVHAYIGLVGPTATCDYYAATNGTSGGTGASGSPWDLGTALNKTAEIGPGETLCLKGGTYTGRFTSNLVGTVNNPVTIRSAPGEWAKVDGNFSTTLTADFSSTDTTLTVSDVSSLPLASDLFGAIIDNEIFRIYGRTGNVLNVYDRRPSNDPNGAANHSTGAQLLVSKSIFEVNGAYTTVRDFEITNSSTQRITLDSERGAGVNTVVAGTDVINMVIHDVGHPGIGFWQQVGDGRKIYGSLIWGNGEYDNGGSWTRGSGVYTQNQDGTRYLTDNIWFRNFTGGISVFTTNGYANGYDIEGNISFDHQSSQNFWAGSQNINPIERLKIISNYGYHRGPYSADPQTDFGIGYTTYNIDAEVRDNYMVSNNVTFAPKNFEDLLITGNSIYLRPGTAQALVSLEQNNKVSYTIDNNNYYGDERFTVDPGGTGGIMSYAEWQSRGYDANGTFSASAPPDSYAVRPNAYQAGRANIAVYNWSGQSNVSVDVSNVMASGDTYEVFDAQNIFGSPIATGTYNGTSISIPMTSTTIAPVVGTISHVDYSTHTPSEFGAFVLLSNATAQTVSTPTISPSGGTFSTTQEVTLATNTSGATIRYTTDGSTPTSSSGTVYSAPFTISSTTTVKAIAYKSGEIDSAVVSQVFTKTVSSGDGGGGGGGGGGGSSGGGGGGGSPTTPSTSGTRLINSAGTYYLIQSGQRKGVTSPGILFSCGFEFKDATTATATDNALPDGGLLLPCSGALVKSTVDQTVYLISNGQRYAFTSAAVFLSLGHKWTSVLLVTNPELQALTKASDISNGSQAHLPGTDINVNGTVYWISSSNTKHPYPSLAVWNSWHKDGDFSAVVTANQADLSLTTGSFVVTR